MKVLFVSHEFTRSGGPISLYRMISQLIVERPDWEVVVLALEPGPLHEDYEAQLGVRAIEIPLKREQPYHYDAFLQSLDTEAPDVVLLNGITLYQEALALKWKGLRVLWWIHDGIHVETRDGYPFTRPDLYAMTRHALGYADALVYSARDTLEQYEQLCPWLAGRGEVIEYGIDTRGVRQEIERLLPERGALREAQGVRDGDFVFLCVGAIQERKNQLSLLIAFQRLLDRLDADSSPRCRLFFLGGLNTTDPAAEAYHRSMLTELRPEHADQVRFLGLHPSAFPFFILADCHVLVSTNECSPLANLEAMLCERICISSRVHGIPELVKHGERGYLVDPTDIEDIEAKLEEVHRLARESDPGLAAMKQRALEFVLEQRDLTRMAQSFARVFERIATEVEDARNRIPVGARTNRYIQQQISMRWSQVRHEASFEIELMRHHLQWARHHKRPKGLRAYCKRVLRALFLRDAPPPDSRSPRGR